MLQSASTDTQSRSGSVETKVARIAFDAFGNEYLAATIVGSVPAAGPSAIAFHGTGRGIDRHRIRYLLDPMAARGVSSISVDFSGHGDSPGSASDRCIEDRLAEARAVCAHAGTHAGTVLMGTSLGGYLAARLAPAIEPVGLVLFCPAAYAPALCTAPLDDGFAARARAPGAHRDSESFAALGMFAGRLLVVSGDDDPLADPALIEQTLDAACAARSRAHLRLEGVGHDVHGHFMADAEARTNLVEAIVALTADRDVGE